VRGTEEDLLAGRASKGLEECRAGRWRGGSVRKWHLRR